MEYRKRPVTIEAKRLENNYESITSAIEFVFNIGMETSEIGERATVNAVVHDGGFVIPTLEGNMMARFGDYIIQGVNGEFYPCKPDIFEKTYDPVEN